MVLSTLTPSRPHLLQKQWSARQHQGRWERQTAPFEQHLCEPQWKMWFRPRASPFRDLRKWTDVRYLPTRKNNKRQNSVPDNGKDSALNWASFESGFKASGPRSGKFNREWRRPIEPQALGIFHSSLVIQQWLKQVLNSLLDPPDSFTLKLIAIVLIFLTSLFL